MVMAMNLVLKNKGVQLLKKESVHGVVCVGG